MVKHIPKNGCYFILHSDDIISERGYNRIGKLDARFIVEDQYTISIYKSISMALQHFYDNIRIDKLVARDVMRERGMK